MNVPPKGPGPVEAPDGDTSPLKQRLDQCFQLLSKTPGWDGRTPNSNASPREVIPISTWN